MIQNEEDLLLKDLCGRLPYGVVIQEKCVEYDETFLPNKEVDRLVNIDAHANLLMTNSGSLYHLDEVKPYLFPLSSITKEIIDEIYNKTKVYDICIDAPVHVEIGTKFEDLAKIFDIFHKHHIDYRSLIPMGLAKDATRLHIY